MKTLIQIKIGKYAIIYKTSALPPRKNPISQIKKKIYVKVYLWVNVQMYHI